METDNRRFLPSDRVDFFSIDFFNFRMESVNSRLVLHAILEELEDSDVFITSVMVLALGHWCVTEYVHGIELNIFCLFFAVQSHQQRSSAF